ncbi:UDP-glycosyltransferase 89B1 [Acorus calamus]|uniref:UDP-glycosyltransferase 89B1 n=1 Tax=Acorus calamus TaxID=4465 RepID=A0AAV9D995_ACOCL|nr:UDP-glycosyltransferase 89B1 [Acorus calamus]
MSRMCAPHVLLIPYPQAGHLLSMLDLAHHLSLRGLTITVHSTPENLSKLHPLISSSPTVHPLLLPLPDKSQPSNDFRDTIVAMGSLYGPILSWAKAHPTPPVLIVSDLFLGWTRRLAEELSVPRVVFSPSGAPSLSLTYGLWREMPKLSDDVSFPTLPNSPIYPWRQLSMLYRMYREGDPVSEFVKKGMRDNIASWGVIINSFKGMDGAYVEHLKRDLGHNQVWEAGPLNVLGIRVERAGLGPDVKGWLDGCPVGSVVYVCFGTMIELTARQVEVIAKALERSGVRFLWALKAAAASDGDLLPDGFEERTAGRGVMMRGWAAQVEILGHDAVGVFLNHCGWNSILEGVTAGVSLLAWPMLADQFFNARLVVEELGVAVMVCEGEESVPEVGELAEKVKEAVSEGGGEMGVRGRELRRKALEAVEVGGSSYGDLDGFVGEVVKLHCLA